MNKDKVLNDFQLMQLYGNYLLACNYCTYKEIMEMNLEQLETKFKEVTNG